MITHLEAQEIVPHLNINGLVGATFCQTDGHANQFHVVDAYYKAASRLGVKFETYTSVTGIKREKGKVTSFQTSMVLRPLRSFRLHPHPFSAIMKESV
jgi:sarcosine oxidase subunit beta